MKLRYNTTGNREQWKEGLSTGQQKMARAATKAFRELAKDIERRGRAAIAASGLGIRFQRAFFVRAKPRFGYSLNPTLRGYHRISYANIFERGTTIRAKSNLLWIPLPSAPQRISRQRLTPKLYVERIGPLHSINNPGKPPLLAGNAARATVGRAATVSQLKTGARRSSAGKRTVSVPIFVGISAAKIRDRLDIDRIYREARDELPRFYREQFGDRA